MLFARPPSLAHHPTIGGQCLSDTCFLDLVKMSGLKLARNASRLDLEKEVLCVSISDARSHPLAPTVTSRSPGRPAMYTAERARVKVVTMFGTYAHLNLVGAIGDSCPHSRSLTRRQRAIRSSGHYINSGGVRSNEECVLISRIECQSPNPLTGQTLVLGINASPR